MTEYKLKKPIVLGEETIHVLKISEPTVKKLREHEVDLDPEALTTAEGQYRLICACSNVTPVHVDLMTMQDMTRCLQTCMGFFSQESEKESQD